ncbi:MAG TPA: hypothetical protein ENF33_02020, partial [Nitrososphaeria archaeon]|nr:hypothetical protein [Nitrososphaeria archaeon]
MTYASISDVKWWLKHPQDDTSLDAEINGILESVDSEINNILSEYTETPITDEGLKEILGDIEAQWAAGVLRQRRIQSGDEEDIYIQVA